MDNQLLLERMACCTEWQIRNQVTDRQDANRGRFIRSYDQATGHLILTGNWQTGTALMALLAVYRLTGDPRCLDAAELAGRYIMSLQVMDSADKYYGAIRELTPQSLEFAPRDATSAAWALVWLYTFTGDETYLRRAILFAEFHLKYCMCEGWPLYACYMTTELDDFLARGSFQSGTGLFYYDLFMASKDPRYIASGLRPIADNYRKYFIREDGSLVQEREIFTWAEKPGAAEQGHTSPNMHAFNDDFGAPMLWAAAGLFGDEEYRLTALRFVRWLAAHLPGNWEHTPSAVPMGLMYFNDFGNYYQDQELLTAREWALGALLNMQYLDRGDPKLDGAFKGRYEGAAGVPGGGARCLNNRTTSYALIALAKLAGDPENIWLGARNSPFVDPLTLGPHLLKY
ncbi:MAG: hypothetical protein K9N49_01160 [Candidatus Marinimicrobia bacterium]|nr:hypothetical protein [Candidatus Neomarinimicrobiota bacterium]